MFKPLKDITILDLTQVLAGPFGSYQLSLLGANVIKIENPDLGDWARIGGDEKELSDKPFLKQPFGNLWETYTWNEVGLMARKLSNGLKSLGLEKNSHIGLVSKNCREWIIADLAISMAGYISVPFFPTLNSKEINNLLTFGDVKALFVGKLENWEEMKKGVDLEMPIIAFPNYKNHSKVEVGHQWHDFINKFPFKDLKIQWISFLLGTIFSMDF